MSTLFELEADGFTHLLCNCPACSAEVIVSFAAVRSNTPHQVWQMTAKEIGATLRCERCANEGMTAEAIRQWRSYRGGPTIKLRNR